MEKNREQRKLPVIYFGQGFKGLYVSGYDSGQTEQEYLVSAKCKILNIKNPLTSRVRQLQGKKIEIEVKPIY